MGEAIMVGMAEIKVTTSPDDILIALGLGSCVGICAYEPNVGVAGMAHVVLPESQGNESANGKFADTAIPGLIRQMVEMGAVTSRIRIAIVGGAQLFAFNGTGVRLEIGPRNARAVTAALEKACIPVVATDLGGSAGRTVHLTGDGRVRLKVIGTAERELISLGKAEGGAGRAAPAFAAKNLAANALGADTPRGSQGAG
jgi:chemotaxis protein CheD